MIKRPSCSMTLWKCKPANQLYKRLVKKGGWKFVASIISQFFRLFLEQRNIQVIVSFYLLDNYLLDNYLL